MKCSIPTRLVEANQISLHFFTFYFLSSSFTHINSHNFITLSSRTIINRNPKATVPQIRSCDCCCYSCSGVFRLTVQLIFFDGNLGDLLLKKVCR